MSERIRIPITITDTTNTASQSNKYEYKFPNGFEANNCEIALERFFHFRSYNNITSAYANNTVSYKWNATAGAVTVALTLPDGYYSPEDIIYYIQTDMKAKHYYVLDDDGEDYFFIDLVENPVYYGDTLTCKAIPAVLPTGYTDPYSIIGTVTNAPTLVITNAEFGKLIGFALGSFPPTPSAVDYTVESTLVPRIDLVSNIVINCNMIDSYGYSPFPQSLYVFCPEGAEGDPIEKVPNPLSFVDMKNGKYDRIEFTLLDQSNNALNLIDPEVIISVKIQNRTY